MMEIMDDGTYKKTEPGFLESVKTSFDGVHLTYKVDENDRTQSETEIISDGTRRLFESGESGGIYIQYPQAGQTAAFTASSPLLSVYTLKSGEQRFSLSANDVGGARKALIQAHEEVTGETKKPGNKFNYADKETAKQVFERTSQIMAGIPANKSTTPSTKESGKSKSIKVGDKKVTVSKTKPSNGNISNMSATQIRDMIKNIRSGDSNSQYSITELQEELRRRKR